MTHHKIRIFGSGQSYTVHLDDQDITAALREISIRIPSAGAPGRVVLKGAINSIDVEGSTEVDVQVMIPESARRLLEHLGWTPPFSDQGTSSSM